jgi:hypothetical protein
VSRTEHIEVESINCVDIQLLLRSKTRYYSRGSIIADSRETAKGLIVITSGQVLVLKMLLGIVKRNNKFFCWKEIIHFLLAQSTLSSWCLVITMSEIPCSKPESRSIQRHTSTPHVLVFTKPIHWWSWILLRQVGAEIPIDSDDADEAHRNDNGRTLLYVFSRGYDFLLASALKYLRYWLLGYLSK